jgi:tetratricopeptide (TPR) repeat protein
VLYYDQGRYGDAEPLYKRSLAIREKALGRDHPDVASSLNNLAALYRNQGRYADALPLVQRVISTGHAWPVIAIPVLIGAQRDKLISSHIP